MKKCKVVAEIGINHNGSLINAVDMIKKCKDIGCDYVKFQKRDVDSIPAFKLAESRETIWGSTYGDYKKAVEFHKEDYDKIDIICSKLGISWFASPWDPKSTEFIDEYDIPFIKVASAMIFSEDVIESISSSTKPVILSTGMAYKKDIDHVIDVIGKDRIEYILACTSSYPTKPEEVNLNFMLTLKKEYPKHKIGFSNHFYDSTYMELAASMGAEMIEAHVTLSKDMYGTDQKSSLDFADMERFFYKKDLCERGLGSGDWEVFDSEKSKASKIGIVI